ncbi:MAG: MBL fold metallo-hydrolase [Rickettsiales bacterium]
MQNDFNSKVLVTILGCGCSSGVPIIGCNCNVCKSDDIKNKRFRSAIFVQYQGINILIDSGPDIKHQLLKANVKKIDYLIITHQHYDHVSGLNELRSMKRAKDIILIARKQVIEHLMFYYSYVFSFDKYKQTIITKNIEDYDEFDIGNLKLDTFLTYHAQKQNINNIGIKINNFIYANDISSIPENSLKYFYNLDILMLDCKNYKDTNIHIGLETVLKWNIEFKPKKIILTNMSHQFDYNKLVKELPNNIIPAFDNMQFKI